MPMPPYMPPPGCGPGFVPPPHPMMMHALAVQQLQQPAGHPVAQAADQEEAPIYIDGIPLPRGPMYR